MTTERRYEQIVSDSTIVKEKVFIMSEYCRFSFELINGSICILKSQRSEGNRAG